MVHEQVGYDGAKKVEGLKRHLLVDSLGILLKVMITAVNESEGAGLKQLLHQNHVRQVNVERLDTVLVDGGYQGEALVRWVLEKVLRPAQVKGFVLIPKTPDVN